jgi:Sulfotransferase domain
VSDRRNIIWIASYPKSGNTWVRFLACNLLHGRQESASALNLLVPDVHELGAHLVNSTYAGLVKTHFAFSSRIPLADRTAAAIYVVREPADVLLSNYHYARRSAGGADGGMPFDEYVNAFIQSRGDPRWIELGMGSWEENVRSWLEPRHPFPVLRFRYEDMVANPAGGCLALARLIRPNSSDADIRAAVSNSSFERMREVEEADIREKKPGIFYKPYLQQSIDSGIRFMRSGVVGDGVARLSEEQRARLRSAFRPLLVQLGYESG